MSRTVRSYLRLVLLVIVVAAVATIAVRAGNETPVPSDRALNPAPGTTFSPQARLAQARSLLDPSGTGRVTAAEVECVAKEVSDNPAREQIASNMARIRNKDLQETVMLAYLGCAYDFVLDTYIAYVPASLTPDQRACIRGTYKKLDLRRFAEVIVVDPDAGQTGPLIIKTCTVGGDGTDPFAVVAPTSTTTLGDPRGAPSSTVSTTIATTIATTSGPAAR